NINNDKQHLRCLIRLSGVHDDKMRSFCKLFRKHGAQLLGCSTLVQHYPLSTKAENAKAGPVNFESYALWRPSQPN
ncbi:hypothetical protein HID58_015687, partial [Brassica napus]